MASIQERSFPTITPPKKKTMTVDCAGWASPMQQRKQQVGGDKTGWKERIYGVGKIGGVLGL